MCLVVFLFDTVSETATIMPLSFPETYGLG